MRLPSGDQERGDAGELGGRTTGRVQVPEVKRFASPPAAGISQMWTGMGAALVNKSSLPTSNASSPFSSSFLLAGWSAAAKAISLPSGRQAKC